MLLYKDKEHFRDIIIATSEKYKLEPALIEKDYFATLFLKKAIEKIPWLVFKGGTSLSKCFNIIDRFSEDIDLTLDVNHFSQSFKRNANKKLIEVCEELDLFLVNKEKIQTHTHSNYNCYEIQYPMIFSSSNIKSELKIEMVYIQKSFPSLNCNANSYVGNFLLMSNNSNIAIMYELAPFNVQVQTLERTLIDKIFAICDYFLNNNPKRNSRHIYDIYKLLTKINIYDNNLKELIIQVRNERIKNKICVSTQNGINLIDILKKIIDSEFYKKDYIEITSKLLTKEVSYADAIKSLQTIIDSGLFT